MGVARLLHLAASAQGAENLRAATKALDRDDLVLAFEDALSVGPLSGIDADASLRRAWWETVVGRPLDDAHSASISEEHVWREVSSLAEPVVLWHGPEPTERLFALRACFRLQSTRRPLFEVTLGARDETEAGWRAPAFLSSVALASTPRLVAAFESCAPILDVSRRADRWIALRDRPGEWIRELRGDEIVDLPLSSYDDDLVEACTSETWARSLTVLGTVLARRPASFLVLAWRLRELIRRGALEARGIVNEERIPAELRRAPAAP